MSKNGKNVFIPAEVLGSCSKSLFSTLETSKCSGSQRRRRRLFPRGVEVGDADTRYLNLMTYL